MQWNAKAYKSPFIVWFSIINKANFILYKALLGYNNFLSGGYVTLVCTTAFKADWVGGWPFAGRFDSYTLSPTIIRLFLKKHFRILGNAHPNLRDDDYGSDDT